MNDKANSDDADDTRQLTASERRAIRFLLEREERVAWFWSSARLWGAWISGTIVATWAVVEVVQKAFRSKWGS